MNTLQVAPRTIGESSDGPPRILSITAAFPGCFAVWRDEGGEARFPVLAWARVEYRWTGGSGIDVVAMVPSGEDASLEPAIESQWVGLEGNGAMPMAADHA